MKFRPDWPVNVTLHAKQRLHERLGKRGVHHIAEAFAKGHATYVAANQRFYVHHAGIVLVIRVEGKSYLVVTVLAEKMAIENRRFKKAEKRPRPRRWDLNDDEREDIREAL